jgi:hypothetical protein
MSRSDWRVMDFYLDARRALARRPRGSPAGAFREVEQQAAQSGIECLLINGWKACAKARANPAQGPIARGRAGARAEQGSPDRRTMFPKHALEEHGKADKQAERNRDGDQMDHVRPSTGQ